MTRALRVVRAGAGTSGAELGPMPSVDVGADELRIAVEAVSASHLDLGVLGGAIPGVELPRTLGTDPVGRVVELGSGVTTHQVGQLVCVKPNLFCGQCGPCRLGSEADCTGQRLLGVHRDGGAASEVVVPARSAFPVPEGVDPVTACASIHTVPVALHMLRVVGPDAELSGRTVLVTGAAGAVGSATLQLVAALGGRPVAAVRGAAGVAAVEALGVATVLDHESRPLQDLGRAAQPSGVDVVVETTGDGEVASAALSLLGWRGSFVTCSGRPGSVLAVDQGDLYRGRRRVLGSAASDVADVVDSLRFVAEGQVSPMVGVTLPLAEFEAGYAALVDPARSGKVVFQVEGS